MRLYLRVVGYFKEDLPLIVLSFALIGLSTAASVLFPFLFKILADTILVPQPPNYWVNRGYLWLMNLLGAGPERGGMRIVWLAILACALRLFQEILAMGQRMLREIIGYNGLVRVRCDLFRKLQQLSLDYHKSQPQGDAIYRLSYDTGGFTAVLNVLINNVLVSSVTLILMTVFMLGLNWQLTLITLAVAPTLLLTTRVFAQPLKRRWIEAKEIDSELTTVIQRSVASIGLVQAFGREADEFDRFHSTARSSVRANLRQAWQDSIYWLLVGATFGAGYALLFGYGGWLVYRDQNLLHATNGMTFGSLTVFLQYVLQVYGPMQLLSGSGASVQGGVASVQRVFEVLDRDPIIKDAPDSQPLPRKPRALTFRDVSFEYRPGNSVLRNVNFTVHPGQMVAFVGSSGVGKTTLLNLLPRFYDPTSGSLRLDEHDIRSIRIRDVRAHIALVLQENIILPTTVAENIAYGRPKATTHEIQRAAEVAGAAAFIAELPQGFQTLISENGSNLSGGQRQRIGIARALLTEAPLLVFDEPTSALDPQNEALITQTLTSLKGQHTIVIVSHRLSTVIDCDEIFVMNEGQIAEHGTHAQLVAQRGLYFAMARHQLKLEDTAPISTAG